MGSDLEHKNIAVVIADGFEEVELTSPRAALCLRGATCTLVGPEPSAVRAWNVDDWGSVFAIDLEARHACADAFDALLLPGGVMGADALRRFAEVHALVRGFFARRKPVAALGHALWALIDTGVAEGRKVAAPASLRVDLANAGAEWAAEPVVVDDTLVTGVGHRDLAHFNAAVCAQVAFHPRAEGRRARIVASVTVPLGSGNTPRDVG